MIAKEIKFNSLDSMLRFHSEIHSVFDKSPVYELETETYIGKECKLLIKPFLRNNEKSKS